VLSFAHTLISLPFAFYLDQPVLIFLAAFVFHFFCDSLLHWNIYPDEFKRYPTGLVALDVFGGAAVAWALLGQDLFSLTVLAAIAGGNAPDIIHALWEMTGLNKIRSMPTAIHRAFDFHDRIQLETTNIIYGLFWQAVLVATALYLIL
jgi:hypothetical protein